MKTPWIVGLSLVIGCGTIKMDDRVDGSRGANDAQPGDGAAGDTANDAGRGGGSSGGAGGASMATDAGQDISVTDGAPSADAPRSDGTSGNDVVTIDIPSLVDAPIADTLGDIQTSIDVSSDGRGTGGSAGSGGSGGGGATGGTAGTGGTGGSSGGNAGTGGSTGGNAGTGGSSGGNAGTGGSAGGNAGTGGTGGAVDAGCMESDQAFCSRLGKNCEAVTAPSCGQSKTVNCGACTGVMGCVDHVCQTPFCQWTSYTATNDLRFSRTNIYDAVVAASVNARSLLLQASPAACDAPNYNLYDETATPGVYATPLDITTWWNNNTLGWAALTGDGLGIVTVSADNKTFARASRAALNIPFLATPSTTEFANINAAIAASTAYCNGLAISANGLEFYYTLIGSGTVADGTYRSIRTSTSDLFPNGSPLPEIPLEYNGLSAISPDGLALFMIKGYSGAIFTRGSTSAQFGNPVTLDGWNHKPGRDCTLFGTGSSGGCFAQDIFLFAHP
jgi:hypothetical protein